MHGKSPWDEAVASRVAATVSLGWLDEQLVGVVLEAEELGVASPVDRGAELPPSLRCAERLLEEPRKNDSDRRRLALPESAAWIRVTSVAR